MAHHESHQGPLTVSASVYVLPPPSRTVFHDESVVAGREVGISDDVVVVELLPVVVESLKHVLQLPAILRPIG